MSTSWTLTGAGPAERRRAFSGYEGRIGRYGASLGDALSEVAGLAPLPARRALPHRAARGLA